VLNLPRAATVTPLDNSHLQGIIKIFVYPQGIYFDGKRVGEVISTAVTDKEARA
jgi:hypothetical protein